MLNGDRRKAIRILHEEGKSKNEISRIFNISPKTVRAIILECENKSKASRKDKKEIEPDLLIQVYNRCEGYLQRIYEVLTEEYQIDIGYSTLTRLVRQKGLGEDPEKRCYHVPDEPGAEMQHDTTIYKLKVADKQMKIICSGLYLRYSKMRYIKFYPVFNRFKMKCFFYEALTYFGYTARKCIIDNTNLAILNGTGTEAVFGPEMLAFARTYGFEWKAHEKGHANRKAGKERNFWTVEQNFLPGRSFKSMEDLNEQALEWASKRYAVRPQSKTGLVPKNLFEGEKPYLIKLSSYIEPPFQEHHRITDEYGYIAFNSNYYWIPGKERPKVKILEYSNYIKIFADNQAPLQYPLPAWGTKNEKFIPDGIEDTPYQPNNRKKPCHQEESEIRKLGEICCKYIDFIKSNQSETKQKPRFIRELYMLSTKVVPELFTKAIERALEYHIDNIGSINSILIQLMNQNLDCPLNLPINTDYTQRQAYQQGRFSTEQDSKMYQELLENNHNEEEYNG